MDWIWQTGLSVAAPSLLCTRSNVHKYACIYSARVDTKFLSSLNVGSLEHTFIFYQKYYSVLKNVWDRLNSSRVSLL